MNHKEAKQELKCLLALFDEGLLSNMELRDKVVDILAALDPFSFENLIRDMLTEEVKKPVPVCQGCFSAATFAELVKQGHYVHPSNLKCAVHGKAK